MDYIIEMGRLVLSLTSNDLKFKVAKICQTRHTPFRDGIHKKSWLHWFKKEASYSSSKTTSRTRV